MDVYRLPFGVRTINVNSQHLLINSKPFYCLGVAKHEDSDVRILKINDWICNDGIYFVMKVPFCAHGIFQ